MCMEGETQRALFAPLSPLHIPEESGGKVQVGAWLQTSTPKFRLVCCAQEHLVEDPGRINPAETTERKGRSQEEWRLPEL